MDDEDVHAFFRNYNPIISFDLAENRCSIKRFKGYLYYGETHNAYRHGLGIAIIMIRYSLGCLKYV